MTPQVGQKSGPFDRGESLEPSRGRLAGGPPVRYSMGGEARRMPLESVWRVRDIVVPLKGEDEGTDLSTAATGPDMHGTPRQSNTPGQAQASPVRSRLEVSAEERKVSYLNSFIGVRLSKIVVGNSTAPAQCPSRSRFSLLLYGWDSWHVSLKGIRISS